MELEFELNNYSDIENGEYGAVLVMDAYIDVDINESGVIETLNIEGATLFTYSQDGGSLRELELDESEVLKLVDAEEIINKLKNS